MNDRFLSMLGLCRKAGKLSIGHDAAKLSIRNGDARLCFISKDASERLAGELKGLSREIAPLITGYTMDDIKGAVGKRAGVITINDEGFASKLKELVNMEGSAL